MERPRIDSMTITYRSGPARKKPKAGDEKVVKGVTYIRQQRRVPKGLPYAGAYLVSSGRPVCEWVVKGSEDDRSARRREGVGGA